LYAYFAKIAEVKSPRHSESAYGALLYKLAKQVDPEAVSKRAFELVRISLGQADLTAAEHYVNAATGGQSPKTLSDLYTLLAFQVSTQNYKPALETLDQLGREYWEGVRTLRIIHAIALNRLRIHAGSDAEIEVLLAEPATSAEEFALLTSYQVAGLLHEGELDRARQVFKRSLPRIRIAKNRGYALRNCAAVYFWGEGRDLVRADAILTDATRAFEGQSDAFGAYTTLNNRGALLGEGPSPKDSAERALPKFQASFEALAVFGTQHLEEVGANLGVALLLTGEVDKATTHLHKVLAFASIDFPRVVMESALAFAEVVSGDVNNARERMRQITAHVAGVNLPAATFHVNVNAAAVEAATARNDARFADYAQAAARTGYWAGAGSLDHFMSAAASGTITPQTLPDFLSYDYFQYWSQNPLSIVSVPLLAQ
jgi:tetratricopeptide (TPR) repeat protein